MRKLKNKPIGYISFIRTKKHKYFLSTYDDKIKRCHYKPNVQNYFFWTDEEEKNIIRALYIEFPDIIDKRYIKN